MAAPHEGYTNPHPELIGTKVGSRFVSRFLRFTKNGGAMYETVCDCGVVRTESYRQVVRSIGSRCKCNDKYLAKRRPQAEKPKEVLSDFPLAFEDPVVGISPQNETFCQEYVQCMDPHKAAVLAGYEHTDPKVLLRKRAIRNRIAFLVKERWQKLEAAREEAVRECKVDLISVTQQLMRDREAALTGRVRLADRDPEPIPDNWRMDCGAAVKATAQLAQLHGLMIKRTELTVIDTMEKMNDREIVDFIRRLEERLDDAMTIDASPVQNLIENVHEQEDYDADEG